MYTVQMECLHREKRDGWLQLGVNCRSWVMKSHQESSGVRGMQLLPTARACGVGVGYRLLLTSLVSRGAAIFAIY